MGMADLFRFRAHGLEFRSEIECPCALVRCLGDPEVEVRIGVVPDRIEHAISVSERFDFGRDEAILRTRLIANYFVRAGRTILVAPKPAASPDDVRVVLMGWVLGVLLHQRRLLALHGGVVSRAGRGVVILGQSGAGKSTLVTGLLGRGYEFLDDNIAVVSERAGSHWVEPGVAELRLRDGAAYPDRSAAEQPFITVRDSGKSRARAGSCFGTSPAAIAAIYLVTPADVPRPVARRLSGAARFDVLTQHVFCRHLSSPDQERRRFPALARLAAAAPVTELLRPLAGSPPEELLDVIEAGLSKATPSPESGRMSA